MTSNAWLTHPLLLLLLISALLVPQVVTSNDANYDAAAEGDGSEEQHHALKVNHQHFVTQASSDPVLINVTIPSSTYTADSASSSTNFSVYLTSTNQPSGYLIITAPTGYVALQATLSYSNLSSYWVGSATIPLNYYMPEGTYVASGVYVTTSAGSWQLSASYSYSVTVSFSGSSYGSLQLCSSGNVGYSAFIPKTGITATSISCCSTSTICSLSASTSGQVLSISNFSLSSSQTILSTLWLAVSQTISMTGSQSISLVSSAKLQASAGATVVQTDSSTVTFSGCNNNSELRLSSGSSVSLSGTSIAFSVPTTQNASITVPSGGTLSTSCSFNMADSSAAIILRTGSQLLSTGNTSCTRGNISGSGSVIVTSGEFYSAGCNVSCSAVNVSGDSDATFCGQWPSTNLTGSAVLTIPPCTGTCSCPTAQLQRRIGVITGSLQHPAGTTLLYNMSMGNFSDYGCLDVMGIVTSQGTFLVVLGANLSAQTYSRDVCLLRYTSASGGCLPDIANRVYYTNAPSGYNVTVLCQQIAGPLQYMITLRLQWNGAVTTWPRQSLDTSLAWALVGIALFVLFVMCGIVSIKICRRPPASSQSALFDDRDVTAGPILQEADPFIPALTQPVKGNS